MYLILSLLEAYEELGNNVTLHIKKAGNALDPHYINSRYPDAIPEYSPKDFYTLSLTEELQNAAKEILNFIKEEKEAKDSNGNS